MSRRVPAKEKFLWRGWLFKLSQATSKEAEWQFQAGQLRIRLLYRTGFAADEHDSEIPPEYTAIMQVIGVTSGDGIAASAALALARAETDLRRKLVQGTKIWEEVARRGRLPEYNAATSSKPQG